MKVEPKASMLKHHTNVYPFQVEIQYAGNQYDNILRIAELEQLYERNGKALGMDFTTDEDVLKNEFGACVESYLKLLEGQNIPANPWRCLTHTPFSLTGSTDFGNVTFVVPGIHPYFYIGSDALNHTPEYTAAAGVHHHDLHGWVQLILINGVYTLNFDFPINTTVYIRVESLHPRPKQLQYQGQVASCGVSWFIK